MVMMIMMIIINIMTTLVDIMIIQLRKGQPYYVK